jgi:hypothetical protein
MQADGRTPRTLKDGVAVLGCCVAPVAVAATVAADAFQPLAARLASVEPADAVAYGAGAAAALAGLALGRRSASRIAAGRPREQLRKLGAGLCLASCLAFAGSVAAMTAAGAGRNAVGTVLSGAALVGVTWLASAAGGLLALGKAAGESPDGPAGR